MSSDGLVGVEARHLAALQAIAEERSFSRAAERLGYAQSAVSQQIATLERAVGLKLIERPGGPRPVSLTEAGEVVLRHADRLLARLGALRADLDQLVAGESGTIRVGTFQSAGARILPGVVGRFRARWPEVRVEIREALDESVLLDAVASGALDLTFASVGGGPVPAQLASEMLLEDRYVLLAPPDSPYRGRASVTLQELDGLDVVEPPQGVSCSAILERAWSERASGTRSCHSSRPSRASTPTSRSCRSRASTCRGESRSSGIAIATVRARPRRSSRSRARSAGRSCNPWPDRPQPAGVP